MYHYLEEELDKLRTRVIKMGSLVEEQIDFSFKSLLESNFELGKIVVDRDKKVDKFDVKIDKLCQRIFALTQPVALDLRLIMSALKINNELERMGDIAVNLAERAESLEPYTNLMKEIGIEDMMSKVKIIVSKTIDSFVNNDRDAAFSVIKSDDIIDRMENDIFDKLVKLMETDNNVVKPGAHIITVLKNLERLADHSTNIAEEVVFLVDSKIIKHKKKLDDIDSKPDIIQD